MSWCGSPSTDPLIALTTVVAAEVAAVGLSVRKTNHDPDSEIASSWAIDAAAGLVAIAAVTHLTVASCSTRSTTPS